LVNADVRLAHLGRPIGPCLVAAFFSFGFVFLPPLWMATGGCHVSCSPTN